MNSLENIKKLSSEEVIDKLEEHKIQEFGLYAGLLTDHIKKTLQESIEENKDCSVVCALNNADTSGVLLDVLKKNTMSVMEGISIVAYALGVNKKILYIPEFASDTEAVIRDIASDYGVEVRVGLVNVRANQGCLFIHIVTAEKIANLFEGKKDSMVYVSVNGSELKKVACDDTIGNIVGENNLKDAKGILIGYEFYGMDVAEKTIAEFPATNGEIRVFTSRDCVVSETEKYLTASRQQSCGKCVFCREGLLQLQYMQKEITEGRGKAEFVDLIKEIGEAMTYSTPCTMGQTSSKIALSSLAQFEKEYNAHIKKKECPSGVCFSTEIIYIDPKLCQGCGECMDVCPKDCIEGKAKFIHMIDEFDCDRCGKCMEVCEKNAIMKTTGKLPKLPNRLTKVGRFKR